MGNESEKNERLVPRLVSLENDQWRKEKSTPHQRSEIDRLREISWTPLSKFYVITCPILIGRKIKDMGELTKGEADRIIKWYRGMRGK
jgi:hypothetical protein